MAARKYPRIEDIIRDLTSNLAERGFTWIKPLDNETIRYKKSPCAFDIQIGVEQNYKEEERRYNHVYLNIECKLPDNMITDRPIVEADKILLPTYEVMAIFFRSIPLAYHGGYATTQDCKRIYYHIGFEKSRTSRTQMQGILQELIHYFGSYAMSQMEMITNTAKFEQ